MIGAAPVLLPELLVMAPEMQPSRLVAPASFGFAGAGIGEDCGGPAAGVPPVPDEGATPPTAPVEPDAPLASCPGMVRRITATIHSNEWRRFRDSMCIPVFGRRSIVVKSIASGFESSCAIFGDFAVEPTKPPVRWL
jgi:hypothetical protein